MASVLKAIALRCALIGAALLLLPLHTGDGLSRNNLSWRHEAAAAEPQGSSEKDAFEAAKELGTAKAWDAFLANYPTGFHADLARAYLKKLAGPETPPAATAPALIAGPSNPRTSGLARTPRSSARSDRPKPQKFVSSTSPAQRLSFNGSTSRATSKSTPS